MYFQRNKKGVGDICRNHCLFNNSKSNMLI